eukprot:1144502-Pelagomonas_calceolata.AAC.1
MSTFRCTEFKQQQLFGKNAVASGLQLRLASAVSSRTWQARHTMRSKAKSAIAFDTTLGWSNSIQLSCPWAAYQRDVEGGYQVLGDDRWRANDDLIDILASKHAAQVQEWNVRLHERVGGSVSLNIKLSDLSDSCTVSGPEQCVGQLICSCSWQCHADGNPARKWAADGQEAPNKSSAR